jgi:hypothetical protein
MAGFALSTEGSALYLVVAFTAFFVFVMLGAANMTPEERNRIERERSVRAAREAEKEQNERAAKVQAEEQRWVGASVSLSVLLSEYKDNEIAADQRYKGHPVQVNGTVGDVKRDILNNPYVIVGTGSDYEIPTLQCFLAKGQESRAAALHKGDRVTVRGTVSGLMMNVLVKECEVE